MPTQIKVLEFKIDLSTEQQQTVERWMDGLKSVWNRALRQLITLDQYSWGYKEKYVDENGNEKAKYGLAHCCPVWDFYRYYIDEKGGIIRDRGAKKDGTKLDAPYCQLNEDLTDSRGFQEFYIKNDSYFGLQETIKGDRIKDAPWIAEIPYKIRSGTIKDLSVSWQEYKKSLIALSKKGNKSKQAIFRGKPKFKGKRDKVRTVTHPNPKDAVIATPGNILKGFPKIGSLKVRGLDKRWVDDFGVAPPLRVVKIIKRGGKWYIQLTGEFEVKAIKIGDRAIKPKSTAVGLDVGLKYHYATDDPNKKPVEPLRAFRSIESRMKRTQRRIDHKRLKRLVMCLQSATAVEIKEMCRTIGDARAEKLVANPPKTIKDFNGLIGRVDKDKLLTNKEAQVLKRSQPISNKEAKLLARVTALHDKSKRQRRAFNHKLSTFLVRTYGVIAVEDLRLTNMNRRANVKRDGKGGYSKNNAQSKSGMNKSFADAGLGMLLEMIEDKSAIASRKFIKVNPHNTSQECSNCGNVVKKSLSQRTHECPVCGFVADRDINAAINIKKRGSIDDKSK
ncbi:MAG: hypothetical protein KatS3mg087_0636 [Patescibacteria group bacterium]|nr:MAG: hypothetical protein KatS3mg087_0636 [Patescibacteria group bacterium]